MELSLNGKKVSVRKWNYCSYSSDNYGSHSIAIKLGARTIYYSYDTIIAFNGYNSKGVYFDCICKNEWGPTTEKHLNAINNEKSIRLNREDFEKQLILFLE